MLKKVVIGVLLLLSGLALYINAQPSAFEVRRSVSIKAPAAALYAQVSDFSKWSAWSPWAKLDPAMTTELTGTQGEVGASYAWRGNDQVGQGRMTLSAVKPPESLTIKLEFVAPFAAENVTEFAFSQSAPTATKVTWIMRGNSSFVTKAVGLVMDMDAVVGGDFEKGLAALKELAEAPQAGSSPHG